MLLSSPKSLSELAETAQKTIADRFGLLGSPQLALELKVVGDASTLVTAICPIEAIVPGGLTFATTQKFLDQVEASEAAAVIIPPDLGPQTKPVIHVPEPRLVFSVMQEMAMEKIFPAQAGPNGVVFKDRTRVRIGSGTIIGDFCHIGANVEIGRDCQIYPQVYIDDHVCLGDGCILYPKVTLMRNTRLGDRVIIHPTSVIGDEGFNYNQVLDMERGRLFHIKNAHAGGVVIEDDVEIGAGVTIDRGLATDTVIGAGTKIDNQVHLAHNFKTGRDCIILAQVGVAGSTRIGDRVFLLGQAGIANGINIGDDVILLPKSGVGSDIPAGRKVYGGRPAQEADQDWKIKALSKRELPRVREFWKVLKKAGSFEELKTQFFDRIKSSGKKEE